MILKTINQVIKNKYCLGCGLCSVINPSSMIKEEDGKYVSTFKKDKNKKDHIAICPASGYDIRKLGSEIHNADKYLYELGWYQNLMIARTLDKELIKHAASGGIISAISLYMLESKKADGIICTKFEYINNKVRPLTFIARTKEELLNAQGSKYCPTKTLLALNDLKINEKYVLIGTPCQIAGYRKYFRSTKNNKINIVLTISNFCGGYRDFNELDFFIYNIAKFSNVTYFQHRGDGVPGQMRIENSTGDTFKYPYPDYAKLSPFSKNKRCVYCIDATGELADISCGDAWIKRIAQTNEAWSIVISRNCIADSIIHDMTIQDYIEKGAVSDNEIIMSQELNITSKKYRQYKRIKIQSILFRRVPNWYSTIKDIEGTYYNEIRVILSKLYHNLKYMKK